jgi:hypothetical protein
MPLLEYPDRPRCYSFPDEPSCAGLGSPGSSLTTDDGGSSHFDVTTHPTAVWVVQQLRDAFPDV